MTSRFHRQETLRQVGFTGQKKLASSTVAIVGLGGLGSVSAELLCRAGVGHLILIDNDLVSEVNLHRQLLYAESDIGTPKVMAAKKRLNAIWRDIKIEAHVVWLEKKNLKLLDRADAILDGTDNFATRFLLSAYARAHKKLFVYAGAIETRGMVFPQLPEKGAPQLEDVLPRKDPLGSCRDIGIINTANVMAATLQASIAMRYLLGDTIEPALHHIDAWTGTIERIAVKARGTKEPAKGTTLKKRKMQGRA